MFRAEYQKMRLVNPPPQLSKLTHHPSYLSVSIHLSIPLKKPTEFHPKPPRLHQAFQSHLCKLIELTKVTTWSWLAVDPWWDFFWFKKTGEIRPVEESFHGIVQKPGKIGDFKNINWWKKHMETPMGFYNFEFPKEWCGVEMWEKTLSLARPDWSLSSLSHKLYRSCTCKCGSNAKINARNHETFLWPAISRRCAAGKSLGDDRANQKR